MSSVLRCWGPSDYPLSSRLDENDAIFVLDDVLIPWENLFVYGDIDRANNFFPRTGFVPRAFLQGSTRLGVKLDFIAGLFLRATELTGTRAFRGVEANLGEVIAWRNMIWSLSKRWRSRRTHGERLHPSWFPPSDGIYRAGTRGVCAHQEPDREDCG